MIQSLNPGVPNLRFHKLMFTFKKLNGYYDKAGQSNQKVVMSCFGLVKKKSRTWTQIPTYRFLKQYSKGTWQKGKGVERGVYDSPYISDNLIVLLTFRLLVSRYPVSLYYFLLRYHSSTIKFTILKCTYRSVVFRWLCNHHWYLFPKHFFHPKKKPGTH